MDTQTLVTLAAIAVGFTALAFYLRRPASQESAVAALTSQLASAQSQLVALMEQRIGTADQNFAAQTAAIARTLEGLAQQTTALETARQSAIGALAQATGDTRQAVETLNAQTATLAGAMSNNQTRGKWGEISLQRLVESAGMQEHVDFVQQRQQVGHGSGKPDLQVKLPGNRVLYIDSKVPWDEYQKYVAANDEATAAIHLKSHVQAVKAHIDTLAKREYDADTSSLDYVVMYVPIEPALSTALIADKDLLAYAATKKVVLTSPLSLIVILNNFHKAWDDDAKVRNVDAIVAETDELVKRVKTMVDHLVTVGKHLKSAGTAFNDVVGSYNTRVVPQSEKLDKLREKSMTMAETNTVEFEPRELRAAANASRPEHIEHLRVVENRASADNEPSATDSDD